MIEGSTIGRPIQIEVRFSRSKFREICNAVSFVRFRQEVERRSRRTMFVTESEYLFENGIIEIKIAALASNYEPKVIIGVLHWMVAVFFAL